MSYLIDLQCPECGETFSAKVVQTYCHNCNRPRLVGQGWGRPDERVVLFNTGSGLKYLES